MQTSGGWVESNGYGGYEIKININTGEYPPMLRLSEVVDIVKESIRVHEQTHVNDALEKNPGVFQTTVDGLTLGASAEFGPQSECAAYQAQLNYLNGQLAAGSYSESGREALLWMITSCEVMIAQNQ